MYQPKQVRLYIKSYCPWCGRAMDWLDDHGIPYKTLDVLRNEKNYQEMVQLSGQSLAPVIDVDGHVLADFGPPELAAFWKQLDQAPPAHD
jgi:glutaredoxin 3